MVLLIERRGVTRGANLHASLFEDLEFTSFHLQKPQPNKISHGLPKLPLFDIYSIGFSLISTVLVLAL